MKTIGSQAKEFRIAKGWNSTKMAKEVGTSRQNIEHLEERGGITPKYVAELARVMGMTVDDLIAGLYKAPVKTPEESTFEDLTSRLLPPPRLVAPSPQNEPLSIGQLMAGLAGHLEKMDASTRRRAGRLLEDLVDEPQSHAQFAAMLEAAIKSGGPVESAAPSEIEKKFQYAQLNPVEQKWSPAGKDRRKQERREE